VSVSVRVPTILRPYTQGVSEVSAEGTTLTEVLDSLDASYPGNVYVDDDDVRFAEGLQTTIKDGGQVSIIPAVAGG